MSAIAGLGFSVPSDADQVMTGLGSSGGVACRPRLVPGRGRDLGVLQAERARSAQGELRLVLVLGDAGLGKTRVATELLPGRGETTVGLISHGSPLGDMPSVGSWADALGLRADGPGVDRVCRSCGSGVAGLAALRDPVETVHDESACAQARRYHVVERVPGLLAAAGVERPIVLVLDDAHRGHDAVWEMVLRSAWDHPDSRLCVLVTARPAELARHPIALEVLHTLDQRGMVRRVELTPFSWEDMRALAADHLRRDSVPPALVDWLMAWTRGNPRFAIGLLAELLDAGTDLQAPQVSGIPETLALWVRTELARLDPSATALIELLAVGGDMVDPADLARLTGRSIEHVALALDRLTRCGMVIEHQRDHSLGYQLAHPLTREVVYTDIGGARRRVLHRRVADTLLESGQTEAAVPHLVRAARTGDREAIDGLIELAKPAGQRGVGAQRWTILLTLLDLLPIGDDRWLGVFDALFRRSGWGVLDRTKHYPAEVTAVRRLRRLVAGIGDLHQQNEFRLWLAGLIAYGAGDLDAGQQECRQALALCRRDGCDGPARIAAIELAGMRGRAGDLRGEELSARQLLGEAERAGDLRGIAEALRALGHALGWQGRYDAAEDALLRSIELAAGASRSNWVAQSLALLASFDVCRGHLVSARTRWAQAAAASRVDDPMIGGCGAVIELLAGDLTMSVAHIRQVEGHDPGIRSGLPVRLAGRAALAAAECGALAEARRNLEVMTRADPRTLGLLEPVYWWAEAMVATAEGRSGAAATALRRAVERCTEMNAWALRGFVLAELAEVSGVAGGTDATAGTATWTDDNAHRAEAPNHQALHQLTMAWALIGHERRDEAARAARSAMDGFASRGYELLGARAQFAYANAVRHCDRTAAENALRGAAEVFDACGAVLRREQARALLGRLDWCGRVGAGDPRDVPRDGTACLTTRERQVAELAATGYTAAQIADRLHIGVRTVETHLARVYRKLQVGSKQQLVHRAAEFGFALRPGSTGGSR